MSLLKITHELVDDLFYAVAFFWCNTFGCASEAPQRHPYRWCLFIVVDSLIRVIARFNSGSNTALVLVNRLGDAIISRDFANSLHKKVQKDSAGKLILIGDTSWEVLQDNLFADYSILFIDELKFRSELVYRVRTGLRLARLGIRTCYCLMHHRLEMRDESIMNLTGATERILAEMPFLSDRWYPWVWEATSRHMKVISSASHKSNRKRSVQGIQLRCLHAYHRQQVIANALGWDVPAPEIIEFQRADRIGQRPLVVLAVGAQSTLPFLPIDVWANVAKRLISHKFDVAFSGGLQELRYVPQLEASFEDVFGPAKSQHPDIWIGKKNFTNFMSQLRAAAAYVGRDTGGSHLAYWLGTPSVVLLNDHAGTELDRRCGDFFPYPPDFLPTSIRYVQHQTSFFNDTANLVSLTKEITQKVLDVAHTRPRMLN